MRSGSRTGFLLLRGHRHYYRAIGAAVTGVIASLGLDYGLAVLMPSGASGAADFFALASIIGAAIALRLGRSLGLVLLGGAAVGSLHHFIS